MSCRCNACIPAGTVAKDRRQHSVAGTILDQRKIRGLLIPRCFASSLIVTSANPSCVF